MIYPSTAAVPFWPIPSVRRGKGLEFRTRNGFLAGAAVGIAVRPLELPRYCPPPRRRVLPASDCAQPVTNSPAVLPPNFCKGFTVSVADFALKVRFDQSLCRFHKLRGETFVFDQSGRQTAVNDVRFEVGGKFLVFAHNFFKFFLWRASNCSLSFSKSPDLAAAFLRLRLFGFQFFKTIGEICFCLLFFFSRAKVLCFGVKAFFASSMSDPNNSLPSLGFQGFFQFFDIHDTPSFDWIGFYKVPSKKL